MTVAEVAQAREALALANRVRLGRAQLKRDIRDGSASLRDTIANPPECARTATTAEVVTWPRGFAQRKGMRLLGWASVSPTRRLGDLTERERGSLVEQCRLAGVK